MAKLRQKTAKSAANLTQKTRKAPRRRKTAKSPTKALKDKLWRLVSKFVRLKDADKAGMNVCYTCNTPSFWKSLQAGHGISGRGNAILFDVRVIRPQCAACNIYRHGNYEVFIPKLIKEIGLDNYEALVVLSKKPRKLTKEWYEGEIAYYQAWVDELIVRDSGI